MRTLADVAFAVLWATLAFTGAFIPPLHVPITRQYIRLTPRSSSTSFQNGDEKLEIPILQPPVTPILPRVNHSEAELATPSPQFTPDTEPKLVLPSLPVLVPEETKKTSVLTTTKQRFGKRWKSLQKWSTRPGAQFRLRLGAIATAGLAATGILVPQSHTRLFALTKRWVSHRGFQGLAALGRTVAYIWAVLIAYPRLLDRRANERSRQSKEKALDRRRDQLNRLAGEVARLRQERTTLDAEIRAFRREIIALKAYAKDDSEDIQEAINTEMAHLTGLRSDIQASFVAARQTWSELRAKSPPEAWDDALVP